MSNPSDASWDDPGNQEAFARKIEAWDERNWSPWLERHLAFPFEVQRVEDHGMEFVAPPEDEPFRYGHRFEVLAIEMEDDIYGVVVRAREERRTGHIPLADLEVTSKTDRNYWPVREYVVWCAPNPGTLFALQRGHVDLTS